MVVGTGALVPAGPSSAAQTGPVPGALPGVLTPAVLEAFWDSPVSRAIIDRLAGIERRLDGSAASAQNDMSSLELFQAEVLHRLDAIEQRRAVAPSSSVVAAIEDSRPVQMEVEVTGRRGVAQQEVTAEVPVHGSVGEIDEYEMIYRYTKLDKDLRWSKRTSTLDLSQKAKKFRARIERY
ncbi:UNVERIFIED_CONTAM: hypothetical protein K2H54_037229 [Gekko kuhli]